MCVQLRLYVSGSCELKSVGRQICRLPTRRLSSCRIMLQNAGGQRIVLFFPACPMDVRINPSSPSSFTNVNLNMGTSSRKIYEPCVCNQHVTHWHPCSSLLELPLELDPSLALAPTVQIKSRGSAIVNDWHVGWPKLRNWCSLENWCRRGAAKPEANSTSTQGRMPY